MYRHNPTIIKEDRLDQPLPITKLITLDRNRLMFDKLLNPFKQSKFAISIEELLRILRSQ